MSKHIERKGKKEKKRKTRYAKLKVDEADLYTLRLTARGKEQ